MTDSTSRKLTKSDLDAALGKGIVKGDWAMYFCPVHPDGEKHGGRAGQSLGFSLKTGAIRCFNGCDSKAIIGEVRGRLSRGAAPVIPLHPPARRASKVIARAASREEQWKAVASYRYIDPNGRHIATKTRYERPAPSAKKGREKRFVWQTDDGRTLRESGLSISDMPLYRADAIANSGFTDPVWLVEGEKCADAIAETGRIATCLAGGASQRDYGDALDILFGRRIYLWPDNDKEGREFARRLKRYLVEQLDCDVRVISAPVGVGEDAADYLARGGDLEELVAGIVTKPITEIHGPDHIVVKLPATPRHVTFEFAQIARSRGDISSELTVSIDSEQDYWTRVNVLSTSARESLVRGLKAFFDDVDISPNWQQLVTLATRALREAYLRAGPVELMHGSSDVQPATFVVDGLVVERGGTILFGPPKRGKSQTAIGLAVSVDSGLDTVFPVRYPVPTLYINLERSAESMAARLSRVNRALGLPESRPLAFLNARGKGLADVIERVREAIDSMGIGFVVLDSISRAGLGDLNDNRTANAIIDSMNSLGVAWLGIGHTPRSDDSHLYGSIHQEAGADIIVGIETETSPDGIECILRVHSANDFRSAGCMNIAMTFGPEGLTSMTASELIIVDDPYSAVRRILRSGKKTLDQIVRETGLAPKTVERVLEKRAFVEFDDGTWGIAAPNPLASPFTYRQGWNERLERCYYCKDQTEEFTEAGVPVCQRHAKRAHA